MPKTFNADSMAARTTEVLQPVIATLPKPAASPPAATRVPGATAAEQTAIAGTGFSPAMKKALGQS
jgi:hypothetical protein